LTLTVPTGAGIRRNNIVTILVAMVGGGGAHAMCLPIFKKYLMIVSLGGVNCGT